MSGPAPSYSSFNEALIEDFRANAGEVSGGPFVGRPLLLLHTKGARSGTPRVTPVIYSKDGDRLVVVASKGGAPTHPAWYHNLVANPDVTVEVGSETFRARATVVEGGARERLYAEHARLFPGFLEYRQRTSRVIPVVLLERIP